MLYTFSFGGAFVKNLEISYLLEFYKNTLTEKQQSILELYYNDDLSLAEISEIVGITRQGVRDCIKRGESQLIELEEKLMLARKFKVIEGKADEIKKLISNETFENADKVISILDEISDEI